MIALIAVARLYWKRMASLWTWKLSWLRKSSWQKYRWVLAFELHLNVSAVSQLFSSLHQELWRDDRQISHKSHCRCNQSWKESKNNRTSWHWSGQHRHSHSFSSGNHCDEVSSLQSFLSLMTCLVTFFFFDESLAFSIYTFLHHLLTELDFIKCLTFQ